MKDFPVCKSCGSHEIIYCADVMWDSVTCQWVIEEVNTKSDAYCGDCEDVMDIHPWREPRDDRSRLRMVNARLHELREETGSQMRRAIELIKKIYDDKQVG